jgi:DNA invertase Pin-like site-specific DNA recombinase
MQCESDSVARILMSLIVERVKAGLRNAKATGKRIGRPKVDVDAPMIAALRKAGREHPRVRTYQGNSAEGRL